MALAQLQNDNLWVPQPCEVLSNKPEVAGCFTLEIKLSEGFTFQPGQFTMLYAFGQGEVPISISGDAAETGILKQTIRGLGAATNALERLQAGDSVGMRGPFGQGWPMEAATGKDVVFIAGGLGLAPLRPAIYHILRHRSDFGKVTLLYGTRDPQSILYPEQLKAWQETIDIAITVDHAKEDWQGEVGVVTQLIERMELDNENTLVMICGPEAMMRFCAYVLRDRGIARDDIYLSMERNMKCAVGLCGRCQYGGDFLCKDGPVFSLETIRERLGVREL